MRLKNLFIALAFVVGLTVYGTGSAMAASVALAPKQAIALGQQADRLALQDLTEVRERRRRRSKGKRRRSRKSFKRRRLKKFYKHRRRARRHRLKRKRSFYKHKRRLRSKRRVLRKRHLRRRYYKKRRPRIGIYIAPRYYGSSCDYWHRRCVENWGYRTNSYYGCMRYHGCY